MMETLLQERIEQTIEEIARMADQIPAVVIIHELPHFMVRYMSEKGLKRIGKSLPEVQVMTNQEYHEQFFNADDSQSYVSTILDLLNRNSDEDVYFFQQVRTSTTQDFDWYMSGIRILMRDKQGIPVLTITTAIQVDPEHHISAKVSRLLEENNFLRKNFHRFSKLTQREKEVLKLISLGNTAPEIAKELHISAATAETHRKNIKKKLNSGSNYDLSLYARAFDLI